MDFPRHIFKAYDIRGLVDIELNNEFYYRLGRAAIAYSGAKHVYVGYDMRQSSVPYSEFLIKGVLDQGADVTNIGLISTPMLNIMTIKDDTAQLGMMITASHNPQEYNGCKFMDKRTMMPIGLDSGLDQIRDIAEKYKFADVKRGNLKMHDLKKEYIDLIYSNVDTTKIKRLNVVIDIGNGVEGVLIDDVVERLPIKVKYLFKEPDGRFPNHEPNPIKPENMKHLQRAVIEMKADLGFAFDGDADRIGLVDERGSIISGDLVLALLVPELLRLNHGSAVMYDLRSSNTVKEVIAENGGSPIEARVGRTYMIGEMRKESAVVGGELSNHFYYKSLYGFESGDLTLLYILKILSESDLALSELAARLRRYAHSGEINFEVDDKDAAIRRIEEKLSAEAKRVSRLDGIKMEFGDWWFNVRKSNTEPLLRLVVEAHTLDLMEKKVSEISGIING